MKQALLIAVLVFSVMSSGAQAAGHAYYGPPFIYEIPNPVLTNDTTTVLLKVAVRECVDEIEITFRNWLDSVIVVKQAVGEADTVAFDMCLRIPTSSGPQLWAVVVERTIDGKEPCFRKITTSDAHGNSKVELREIKPGVQSFTARSPMERVGDTVRVTGLVPVYDSRGKMIPGSPKAQQRSSDPPGRGRPHIVETPHEHSIPDSQQVSPKDTVPETTFVPRSEWTEEEKHRVDSLMGLLPWQRERARKAKLEETPLTEFGAQFIEVKGVTYMRNRGERKFRRAEVFTEEDFEGQTQLRWQSHVDRPRKTEFEIRVWLSNPEDMKYARTLIDSLVPTNETDCFLTRTSIAVVHLLQKSGIKTAPTAKVAPTAPGNDTTDSGPSDLEPQPANEDPWAADVPVCPIISNLLIRISSTM